MSADNTKPTRIEQKSYTVEMVHYQCIWQKNPFVSPLLNNNTVNLNNCPNRLTGLCSNLG